MNASQYKIYHELFMQNNHGSTAFHTFLCIFFTILCSLICTIEERNYVGLTQYIYEYFTIVLPMILAHTVFSEYILTLNILVMLLLFIKFMKCYPFIMEGNHYNALFDFHKKWVRFKDSSSSKTIHSITCLRALTYLITGLCILAVDFRDFPRNLAKTEMYGYSLMDTGVGLFVLMSGLVHKDISNSNYMSVLQGNIKILSILFLLGIGRLASIKQLDYQEHVTEYGVHWNFFFTLVVCKLFSTLLLLVCKNSLYLIILTISLHEFFLYLGLQDWVFSDTPRNNFINANREGISSSLGYVFLYLFAAHIKSLVTDKSIQKDVILKKLLMYSVILITFTYISNELRPASRTLANAGYCIYLATLLVTILLIIFTLEISLVNKNGILTFKVPNILRAINNHGLLYFLVSNLTTGLINMIFKTLMLSSFVTFLLLNLHMIFNITLVSYLNK